jgi:hypothetical protein
MDTIYEYLTTRSSFPLPAHLPSTLSYFVMPTYSADPAGTAVGSGRREKRKVRERGAQDRGTSDCSVTRFIVERSSDRD